MIDAGATQNREEAGPSRRERKKERTRQEIYKAALGLFVERGFDGVTIDQICNAADVARGTFFLHFPTKDALLAEYGREVMAELKERLQQYHGPAPAQLRELYRALAERARANRATVHLVIREVFASSAVLTQTSEGAHDLAELFLEIVRRGVEAKELRTGGAPEAAAGILVSTYFGLVTEWARGGDQFDLGAALEAALELILGGIATPTAGKTKRPRRRRR